MANSGNKRTLNLTVKNRHSFNLFLDIFESVTTLLFNIRFTVVTDFIATLFTGLSSLVRIKRVKLVISKVNLIGSQIQIFLIKPIKIVNSMKETGKVSATISISDVMTFVSKAIQKIQSTINLKKITIGFTAILANLYPLSAYDVQTLGTMDVETLGDLDYVLS